MYYKSITHRTNHATNPLRLFRQAHPPQSLQEFNKLLYAASAELCEYNETDAQNKISIFNQPYGRIDHSTASAEVEIHAKLSEFDHPTKTREQVRDEWLEHYQDALIPFASATKLAAPIILTVTFEDWEVRVVTSDGAIPN